MDLDIRIYYKDTDAGGVVYYANYLYYFEIARTEFLRGKGIIVEAYHQQGITFRVVEAYLKYHSPAMYGNVLTIHTGISELRKASFTFAHKITRQDSGQLLVEGTSKLACINQAGKPAGLPEEFSLKLTAE